MTGGWRLACPACGAALPPLPDGVAAAAGDARPTAHVALSLDCSGCGASWPRHDGIWRLLTAADADRVAPFLDAYRAVRAAEGRASLAPAERLALPYAWPPSPLAGQWRIRAASFRCLARRGLAGAPPGRLVDVGAGNGWLAWRLAVAGWSVLALDLDADAGDGLGAAEPYARDLAARGLAPRLVRAVAHADRLPLAAGAADVVLFNASLHYAADPAATLRAAARAVADGGRIVVVDSPIYRRRASGERMVAERRAAYTARYGWPSTDLGSREYLVAGELEAALAPLGFAVRHHRPWAGWRWALRPCSARLRGRREPARFAVSVARRTAAGASPAWRGGPREARGRMV